MKDVEDFDATKKIQRPAMIKGKKKTEENQTSQAFNVFKGVKNLTKISNNTTTKTYNHHHHQAPVPN